MPMTFDQYSNCSYGCLYCFSQYQRGIGARAKSYRARQFKAVSLARFRRAFEDEKSPFYRYTQERHPMQWGGLSDPFDEFERASGRGLEILRYLRELKYPVCFSTKGVWWTTDPRYTELFQGAEFWNVKVTIITTDTRKAQRIERGTPTPDERIEALGRIAGFKGGGATLRLRPFIIGVSNPGHVELIRRSGQAGATALSTEFFCLEARNPQVARTLPVISDCAGMDVGEFYRRHSYIQGYRRLNRNVKRPFVNEMEQAAQAAGMRFYVSDAHFKERCANGSCCGLPESWNYVRGQFCEALQIAKRQGRVTWGDIEPGLLYLRDLPWGAVQNTTSSERRSTLVGATAYDYVRNQWNNPKAGQSPYRMYEGILKPVGLDADRNVVYEYDPGRA